MALSQEQLDQLETQHKRIAHVRAKDGSWEVVFRKPTRMEYKQYRASSNNEVKKADAQEALCRQIVVYPAKADYDILLDEWPAIPEACGEALRSLLSLGADEGK